MTDLTKPVTRRVTLRTHSPLGALIVTMLWFSAASLLNAVAWEPIGLFVARLLTGIGLSAMTAVGITYVAEMFPASKRGTYQGWVLFIGLVGIPAAAIVAYLKYGTGAAGTEEEKGQIRAALDSFWLERAQKSRWALALTALLNASAMLVSICTFSAGGILLSALSCSITA